ncbi:hypothetical protein ABPG74_014703 [Tetrahymena malaccensis]
MRQNFSRQQHQLVPSDLVGYEISPLRTRAKKMKSSANAPNQSQYQSYPKQVSNNNIIIKSLKNISSDQSTEDDDTLNRSSKITGVGSTSTITRILKQNQAEERINQQQQVNNNASIRSLSTGQLQSINKFKNNQFQKASINPSYCSIQNLDLVQKQKFQSQQDTTQIKSANNITEQNLNEEEEEEHNIWDDDLLKIRGIDTENWIDSDGSTFTLFHLYKARFGTHPNQREEITNEEVIKMMKRFSRNRRNKNLERFPWETFNDNRVYCDESDIYYDKNFQIFHKLFNQFYNNDKVRHDRTLIKNNFIQKLQLEDGKKINTLEDEISQTKNTDSTPSNGKRNNSFLMKKNIRSMSQVGQINQHQSQINSGLNSFRIRQIQNNPTQQQPLNFYQAKSQSCIPQNEIQMISSQMLLSKDQSPVKQSPISLHNSQSQISVNSPGIGYSPIKQSQNNNICNNESTFSSPAKKYHISQSSLDQQSFSAMLDSAQNTATKTQNQQPSFKYQLINALKSTQQQEDSYQNYLSNKIKLIQNQKLREQAAQITSSNEGQTRKQSLLKRQNSVNPAQKYANMSNLSQSQLQNINFSKINGNESFYKSAQKSNANTESLVQKKGSYSPVKGRNVGNQNFGNLLHLRNMNSQSHQPSPFNDFTTVKKMNILTLMK